MIYKGNKKYDQFIESLKVNHFYGNNKRIYKILTDEDMKLFNNQKASSIQKKLSLEHDELILTLINILEGNIEHVYPETKKLNYIETNAFIDQKLLQIAKIRMVLMPEFLINTTKHSVSNHEYAVLRALWLDSDFRKIKKISVSLGNVETLENSKILRSTKSLENLNSIEITRAKESLTKRLLDLYREEYN
jgi:hypothetical protein